MFETLELKVGSTITVVTADGRERSAFVLGFPGGQTADTFNVWLADATLEEQHSERIDAVVRKSDLTIIEQTYFGRS